ncbi:MAG: ZIP family metal transporter [Ruminococcus sp.]|nr:ZIP family metal transporter [Ruminococcus sp.]
MNQDIIIGLMIPFCGTAVGAAAVFFMKKALDPRVSRALTGFAAGVMTAASVWSLIIPAIEQSEHWGRLSFLPAVIGFWAGVLFLLLIDRIVPRLTRTANTAKHSRTAMMVLAVTLHNIPEGMAVGVAYAGFLSGTGSMPLAGALALATGIAIQNIPEGAIISMPLHAQGRSKGSAFLGGVLSGAVEPVFGALALILSGLVIPAMPCLLSFAAGAMICVVARELIPEMTQEERSCVGVVFYALGFTVMMAMDVALG